MIALPPSPSPSDPELAPPTKDYEAPSTSRPTVPEILTPQRIIPGASLTQQPFGETEEQVHHTLHPGDDSDGSSREKTTPLAEVDFLDLNAPRTGGMSDDEGLEKEHPTSFEGDPGEPPMGFRDSSDGSLFAVLPSSLLNTATALLPSIPFISSTPSSSKSVSPKEVHHSLGLTAPPLLPDANHQTTVDIPLNPMTARPGEPSDLPVRDETLSSYSKGHDMLESERDAAGHLNMLPRIKAGDGEGPDIVYGKDVVLDMAGYHSTSKNADEQPSKEATGVETKVEERRSAQDHEELAFSGNDPRTIKDSQVDTFARDLLASILSPTASLFLPSRPIVSTDPATDTAISQALSIPGNSGRLESNVNSSPELPSGIASLSLQSSRLALDGTRPLPRRRSETVLSMSSEDSTNSSASVPIPFRHEPFPSQSPLSRSPKGALFPPSFRFSTNGNSNSVMSHAWDRGRVPTRSNEEGGEGSTKRSLEMERSTSGPPAKANEVSEERLHDGISPTAGLDLATPNARTSADTLLPGKLKNIEDSPFSFVLDMEGGRSHTFELALCGEAGFAMLGEASVSTHFAP